MKKTAFLALALFAVPAFGQEAPKKIDVSKLPKETRVVEDVIVPVPSEIFGVLDKLGKPNWVAVQRPLKKVAKSFGERPQQALYLGTVIAEGFIAVEAGDAEEVKIIGNSVLSLSEALGVRKAVTSRANAIINAADKERWADVRRELDGALSEVKDALLELGDADVANLIALGGWIRGTEALCAVVAREYSRDGADLLHQPVLVDHFTQKLKELKFRPSRHPLVPKAKSALSNIRPLIVSADGTEISAKSVKEVGAIAISLVKDIQTQPK